MGEFGSSWSEFGVADGLPPVSEQPEVTIVRGMLDRAPADEHFWTNATPPIVASADRGQRVGVPEIPVETPIAQHDLGIGAATGLPVLDCPPGERLHAGGIEEKYVVTTTIEGEEASFIERTIGQEPFIEAWHGFRKAGLSVPPEVYQTDRGTFLVSDLKADGSELYGKGMRDQLGARVELERPRPEVDRLFTHLTDDVRFDVVETAAFERVGIASEHGIELPYDDPFEMLVRPDGSWDIVTLDLRRAVLNEPSQMTDNERLMLRLANERVTCKFLDQLRDVRMLIEDRLLEDRFRQAAPSHE